MNNTTLKKNINFFEQTLDFSYIELKLMIEEVKEICNKLNKEIGITFEDVCQEIKDSGYSIFFLKSPEIAFFISKAIYDALGYDLDFLNIFSNYREAAIAYFGE